MIIKAFKDKEIVDVHKEISIKLAVILLCKILGFKNLDEKYKDKLFIWSERSADTGMRYSLDENADYYMEGHEFFLKTLEEV